MSASTDPMFISSTFRTSTTTSARTAARFAWRALAVRHATRVSRERTGTQWDTPGKPTDLQIILASWFPDNIGKNATAVLFADNCRATYELLKGRGVEFSEAPQPRPFGLQAVFHDLYGNSYALVQPGQSNRDVADG